MSSVGRERENSPDREWILCANSAPPRGHLNTDVSWLVLSILYECSDLRKYALRLAPEANDFTLDELERAIWTFVTA